MYGFSLVAILAAVLVAMGPGAEGWPFRGWRAPAPVRGAVATAAAVALTAVIVHGFFWGFLGRFGVTYFSPRAIVAAGGVGAEFFNARENASTAIVYFADAFLWTTLVLALGFGAWPWEGTTRGVRAVSRLAVAALLAVVAYADPLPSPRDAALLPGPDDGGRPAVVGRGRADRERVLQPGLDDERRRGARRGRRRLGRGSLARHRRRSPLGPGPRRRRSGPSSPEARSSRSRSGR